MGTLVPWTKFKMQTLIYPGTVLRFSADQKEVAVDSRQNNTHTVFKTTMKWKVETTEATTQAAETKQLKQLKLKLLNNSSNWDSTKAAAASSSPKVVTT